MSSNEITKSDRRKLELYYCLILSYSDFKHAYRCAQYSMDEHERLTKDGGDDLILRALYCSMVVSYSRPFNSSGTSRIGKIPPLSVDDIPILSGEELEIHEYLLLCRNKFLAHSDAETIDPDPFVATDLPGNLVIPEKNDSLAPFTQEYTAQVLALTEKAYHFSVEDRVRLESEIEQWLPRKRSVSANASIGGT